MRGFFSRKLGEDASCQAHPGYTGKIWIVCVHADPDEHAARKIDDPGVEGEAVCDSCRLQLDALEGKPKPPELLENLRIACAGCIRENFRIGDAN